MKVQRDGRDFKVVVAPDGEGLVSHAGSTLLAQVAEKTGLTGTLSSGLSDLKHNDGPGTIRAVWSVTWR